jgi:hypothetical protein
MSEHPLAMDASPDDRRALRFKVIAFYAKWEPQKPTTDVVDLVEWALENGVEAFNTKLKGKYGEDLHSVSASSFVDLSLESQLKVFYSEYDAKKPQKEIDDVSMWARGRPTGVTELNSRLEKKYGENLNTMAFGGRLHLRVLLQHYLTKVDPLSASDTNISEKVNYAATNGSVALMKLLMDKYKVPLHLSIAEIEGREHEIEINPSANIVKGDSRPAVVSLMRGQVQPINGNNNNNQSGRPQSVARRPLSVALSVGSQGGGNNGGQPNKYKLTVSEDAEMKGLLEVYYAKHNPEKLSEIESVMKYVRTNGPDALNRKLMDRYGEDLNGLKKEYDEYLEILASYYEQVDPSKTNIDDVATWAIVHGIQPLSERLKKKYGKGLFEDPDQVQLEQLDPESLKARIRQFYQVHDPQNPKSESDLDTILHWVLASSVAQLNAKLVHKYGKTLNDLPPLTVGKITIGGAGGGKSPPLKPTAVPKTVLAATTTTTTTTSTAADLKPETLGGGISKPPRAITPPAGAGRGSRSNSFASVANEESADNIDTQVSHLREISSGRFDGLAAQIRAFYRANDPDKLKNKEAVDLMFKWTFKHGVAALNKKFKENYGRTLDEINVTEADVEADEADDVVGGDPNW